MSSEKHFSLDKKSIIVVFTRSYSKNKVKGWFTNFAAQCIVTFLHNNI